MGNRYCTSEQLNRRMVYLRVRRDYVEAFKKDLKRDLRCHVNQLVQLEASFCQRFQFEGNAVIMRSIFIVLEKLVCNLF